MIKRLVRKFTGKTVKTKDGKEFESSYFYLELTNGKKIFIDVYGNDSKNLARLICEDEH